MRFRLVEARDWPPSTQTLDDYAKQSSLEAQKTFIKNDILPHPKFRDLFGIRPILIHSMMINGLDPNKNKFLNFLCKIPFKMPDAQTYRKKMLYVYDSYNNKKLDIKSPILLKALLNPTLWTRSFDDFQYTLNAFNIFSQPKLYKAYLKDTDKTKSVTTNAFMNGKTIKDAGRDGRDGDTIYNQIEAWAENNEYSQEEIEANKKRAEEEEEGKKKDSETVGTTTTSVKWTYDYFKAILETVFANVANFKTELTKNDYLERAFATFELLNLEASQTENTITVGNTSAIKDSNVKQFGDPHQIDTPIYVTAKIGNESVPGVYIFHKFISLEDRFVDLYKQTSKKNLGNLKRHLAKVNPDNVTDVNILYQAVIDAFNELTGIPHR